MQSCVPLTHLGHGAASAGTSLQSPEEFEFLCYVQGLPGAAAKGISLVKNNGLVKVICSMEF